MPIRTAIWKIAAQPQPLAESSLPKEQYLENMIVAAPQMLSDEWMLIGRQENTGSGGRIDLLAIAPDGSLVLIELKRERTPRDVVAQSLDYAAWVEALQPEDIAAIYSRFAPGRSLAGDFRQRFGQELDEETLNESHQIIIVAASLDNSTERIVAYLSDRVSQSMCFVFRFLPMVPSNSSAAHGCWTRCAHRLSAQWHQTGPKNLGMGSSTVPTATAKRGIGRMRYATALSVLAMALGSAEPCNS